MECKKLIQVTWEPIKLITANGRFQFEGYGLEFNNAGDEAVTLNEIWTIPAGGAKSIGLSSTEEILALDLTIQFAGGGANPRLEVAALLVNELSHNNFSRNGQYS